MMTLELLTAAGVVVAKIRLAAPDERADGALNFSIIDAGLGVATGDAVWARGVDHDGRSIRGPVAPALFVLAGARL